MCGIAGVLTPHRNQVDRELLESMGGVIAHRGPDDHGEWHDNEGRVGLSHRRLSIIDLSSMGRQPMANPGLSKVITFNGEIYNYLELRKLLESKGYAFRTETDTEVLLCMYDEYGRDMLQHLDGMFAFAIWDSVSSKLFCARDRFGEKPFYYYLDDQKFVFGSEIKAIWASGVPKSVNNDKRINYVDRGVIRTRNTVTETIFDSIYILDAAHSLEIGFDLSPRIQKYWSLENIHINRDISFSQSVERFRELLEDSVRLRLRADVPVGSSLSGGVDSSSIVAFVDKMIGNQGVQNTFTARFPGFSRDEGKFAKMVAEHVNSVEYHEIVPTDRSLLSLLEEASWFHEEPIGSSSVLAQYQVYKLAKDAGTKVLIDGQGADEYLAGYVPIYNVYLDQLFEQDKWLYRKEYARFTERHHLKFHKPAKPLDDSLRERLREFWTHKFCQNSIAEKGDDKLRRHLRLLSTQTTLKELLRYADRNSMAHSREVRLPFLSHHLVEFTHSLPEKFLLTRGWTKYILRMAVTNELPKSIVWRSEKVGFEPPQQNWMDLKHVQELLQEQRTKYKIQETKNISYTNSSDWRLLADAYI